jgi:hypothetical protein
LQPLLQQRLWQLKIRSSKQLWQRDLQHFGAHPLLQPQLGAAAAQVGAASQPQAGAAAAQPLLQPVMQHLGLQQRWKLNKGLWQQRVPQPLLQPLSQPQLGAASQPQAGPAGAAQVGASQQLFLAQQLDSQQPPPTPSIRSSKSKPKLWVHRAMPNTTELTRIFHFIEPRSPFHWN